MLDAVILLFAGIFGLFAVAFVCMLVADGARMLASVDAQQKFERPMVFSILIAMSAAVVTLLLIVAGFASKLIA